MVYFIDSGVDRKWEMVDIELWKSCGDNKHNFFIVFWFFDVVEVCFEEECWEY